VDQYLAHRNEDEMLAIGVELLPERAAAVLTDDEEVWSW
jgi:hypothetical protein